MKNYHKDNFFCFRVITKKSASRMAKVDNIRLFYSSCQIIVLEVDRIKDFSCQDTTNFVFESNHADRRLSV